MSTQAFGHQRVQVDNGEHRCTCSWVANWHSPWQEQFDAHILATTEAGKDAIIEELCNALRLTVEYVGNGMLPAIKGWSWYDALTKYAPEMAQDFVTNPVTPNEREHNA